jgi:hypothetical protein
LHAIWDLRFSWWWRCRCWSSGLWRRVDLQVGTNVLKERTAFIFRTKDWRSMFLRNGGTHLQVYIRHHNP